MTLRLPKLAYANYLLIPQMSLSSFVKQTSELLQPTAPKLTNRFSHPGLSDLGLRAADPFRCLIFTLSLRIIPTSAGSENPDGWATNILRGAIPQTEPKSS